MTSRGVKCSPAVVADFRELPDQLLEHQAHLVVVDRLRVQVDAGEPLRHLVQQPGLGQALDLGVELEAVEHVAYRWRERLHVAVEVFPDVILVPHELLHVQGGGVAEGLAGPAQEERLGVQAGLGLGRQFGQHGRLGWFQHAVQAAQDGERQDDPAVLGLLVIAAQEVGDGPDERGKVGLCHAALLSSSGLGGMAGFVSWPDATA